MKLMKLAPALITGLLLTACSSPAADPTPTPSAPIESASAEPTAAAVEHAKADAVITDLKKSGECEGTWTVEAPTEGSSDGFGCLHQENGRNYSVVVAQADSKEDAIAFAEAAFYKGSTLPIDAGTINHYQWDYGYDSGLVISGNTELIDKYMTGNFGMLYSDEDIINPVLKPQIEKLRTTVGQWHGRCEGSSGHMSTLFEPPTYGEYYDQCYTSGRLTEINTVSGWWQMVPYLDEQKDLLQAPQSGSFYALVNENWAVVDNVADKKSFEELQEVLGGEIIDLRKFDEDKFTADPEKLK